MDRTSRTASETSIRYEPLDYAATLAKLGDLTGREVLVELRVGGLHGPFRLASRGVPLGPPVGQDGLTGRRPAGHDLEAFKLDTDSVLHVAVLWQRDQVAPARPSSGGATSATKSATEGER